METPTYKLYGENFMATAVYGSLIIFILLILAIIALFLVVFLKNKDACLIPIWWYFLIVILACFFLSYVSSQESVVITAEFAHHSYSTYNLILAYFKMFISCFVIFNIPSLIFCLIYFLKFKLKDFLKSI